MNFLRLEQKPARLDRLLVTDFAYQWQLGFEKFYFWSCVVTRYIYSPIIACRVIFTVLYPPAPDRSTSSCVRGSVCITMLAIDHMCDVRGSVRITMLLIDHMSGVRGSVCIPCSRTITCLVCMVLYVLPCSRLTTCLVYMVLCVYHAPERSFVWCTWFCTYCAMLPIDHMCDVHGSERITMLLIDHMSGVHGSVVLPCS